ncbi:MAG: hypothetical protein AB7O97_00635 [Planctomycetota bacterium]
MRRSIPHVSSTALLALLSIGTPAPAQQPGTDPTLALAEAMLAQVAPATDDPDASYRERWTAALAARRSPVAAALAEQAGPSITDLADPDGAARWLQEQDDAPMHGLLRDELHQQLARLAEAGGHPAPADPFPHRARRVVAVGPFGDGGRYWLDEPFAPDVAFPAPGDTLPGRFGPVTARIVEREPHRPDLQLQVPSRPRDGCWYAEWHVVADAEAIGFLEVAYRGAFLARVDGVEVGRRDPVLDPASPVQRFAVRLQPGAHRVAVKTGDDGDGALALRLVDALGAPLAQTREQVPGGGDDAPAPAAPGDPRGAEEFRDAGLALEQAATAADGDARATLRTAAAWVAQRRNELDRALVLLDLLQQEPPQTPAAQLVLAEVLQLATTLPEEQRTARARELQAAATAALPAGHYTAVTARARKMIDQDQREDALRLLRGQVAADAAGPATFSALYGTARRLSFDAELPRILEQWIAACPGDVTPVQLYFDRLREAGAHDRALQLAREQLPRHPLDEGLQRRAFLLALDAGDRALAEQALDAGMPASAAPSRQLRRLRSMLTLCRRCGDQDGLRRALAELAAHPDADAGTFRECAEAWLQLGDDAAALAAVERSLQLDSDQPPLQELRARLGGAAAPGDDFARFRRDGDAAIAAFQPGPGEQAASSSMLIDQRLVELLPDGSAVVEVHELRRVNDLQGVEALRAAEAPAGADELLLLRTVGTDGRTYVPTKVDRSFAMPRLEPGAFVEWRYRNRLRAQGAGAWRLEDFLLASYGEPLHRTEYVLITPADVPGELRWRNLDAAPVATPLDGDRTARQVLRTDVPRMPEESSTPGAEQVLPVTGWGADASPWPHLRRMRTALWWRTRPTPPVTAFAQELFADAADAGARAQKAWAFCQQEIADGNDGAATEVLLRRKGNRFVLAVALLRAGDVPVLAGACERARRPLTGEAEPLFATEDRAAGQCVRLELPEGPVWLFDDVPRFWPFGAVPSHRRGALAYAISAAAATQHRLPDDDAAVQILVADGTCAVTDDTDLHLQVEVGNYSGYALAEQLRRRTADIRKLAVRQVAQQFFPNWRVRDAAPVGIDPGGQPLRIELHLQDAGPQRFGDDRWLLPLPLPPSDLRSSFGDRDERTLPLQITRDVDMRYRVAMDPGEDREFAALPPPILAAFGPLDYQLTFTRDGHAVVLERRLRLRPGTIQVAVYGDWIRLLAAIDRAEQQRLELLRRRR